MYFTLKLIRNRGNSPRPRQKFPRNPPGNQTKERTYPVEEHKRTHAKEKFRRDRRRAWSRNAGQSAIRGGFRCWLCKDKGKGGTSANDRWIRGCPTSVSPQRYPLDAGQQVVTNGRETPACLQKCENKITRNFRWNLLKLGGSLVERASPADPTGHGIEERRVPPPWNPPSLGGLCILSHIVEGWQRASDT